MYLGPGYSMDYGELIADFESKKGIKINDETDRICPSNMITNHSDAHGYSVITRALFSVNMILYSELSDNYDFDSDLQYLFKQLLYDFFDFNQAINTFCGIQLFTISRSIMEHSRMAILCFVDIEFKNDYFSEYTSEEKKTRYYKKRETNITKMLQKIANEAKKFNSSNDKFDVKELLTNLLQKWYHTLSDNTGELFHLNEITFTKKLIGNNSELTFQNDDYNVYYYKLIDEIIEYLFTTTEIVLALFYGVTTSKMQNDTSFSILVKFVHFISDKLHYSRNIDTILEELTNKVLAICNEE